MKRLMLPLTLRCSELSERGGSGKRLSAGRCVLASFQSGLLDKMVTYDAGEIVSSTRVKGSCSCVSSIFRSTPAQGRASTCVADCHRLSESQFSHLGSDALRRRAGPENVPAPS